MISKKNLQTGLKHLWQLTINNINEHDKCIGKINEKIRELESEINIIREATKKITDNHYKKIQMLIDSENTVRLAINKIAEELIKKNILTTKKEQKTNEWTKSKSNNRKQSVPKHSEPRFIQK